MNNKELVWDRLKNGILPPLNAVRFHGNGIATNFNSAWIADGVYKVTVNDVAQSVYRDFQIENNDVIFRQPPPEYAKIRVEVYPHE